MSTELMGLIGIVLWVMVLVAQLRKKSATGSARNASRRGRNRTGRLQA